MKSKVRWYMKAQMLAVIDLDRVCRACGFPEIVDTTIEQFQFLDWPHHIILRSQGGGHTIKDMILLCNICGGYAHGVGNLKDNDGHRITGQQFMLSVLDNLINAPDYRWQVVHEKLRQVA